MVHTANGSFEISQIQADEIRIVGTGSEVVTGNDSIQVKTTVVPDNYQIEVIH